MVLYFFPALFVYFAALAFFTLPVADYFSGHRTHTNGDMQCMFCAGTIFLVAGILGHRRLRRQLRFQIVTTSRTASENYVRVLSSVTNKGWTIRMHEENHFILCFTPMSPFSFGDRVTIYFKNQDVWVNSICEPSKPMGGLFGPHKKNVDVVQAAVI